MSILRVMEFQLAFRNYYVSCWIPRTNIGEKFYMFSRFNAILATDRQTDDQTTNQTEILAKHICAMYMQRAAKIIKIQVSSVKPVLNCISWIYLNYCK